MASTLPGCSIITTLNCFDFTIIPTVNKMSTASNPKTLTLRHTLTCMNSRKVGLGSVQITWKPEYAGPPHLFSLPHRANSVVEYLGTEGPHTYFSVIRLMGLGQLNKD